jgi:hypothetical protein
MYKIGKPLGWDNKYRGKLRKQKTFIEMISEKTPDQTSLNFSAVLDELALIYVLKQEVMRQTQDLNIQSSEDEDDLERMNDHKKTLQQGEEMGDVRMVKDLMMRKKTVVKIKTKGS